MCSKKIGWVWFSCIPSQIQHCFLNMCLILVLHPSLSSHPPSWTGMYTTNPEREQLIAGFLIDGTNSYGVSFWNLFIVENKLNEEVKMQHNIWSWGCTEAVGCNVVPPSCSAALLLLRRSQPHQTPWMYVYTRCYRARVMRADFKHSSLALQKCAKCIKMSRMG